MQILNPFKCQLKKNCTHYTLLGITEKSFIEKNNFYPKDYLKYIFIAIMSHNTYGKNVCKITIHDFI